jgi:O-acetyl-ADP-ribose deacetylase (regulator of RNase III)
MDPVRLNERLVVTVGDITHEDVDAIVNAANSKLMGGGGVDGAIHAGAGPELLEACREVRATKYPDGLPTGKSVITPGGQLRARHVIHTVGPIYGKHNGEEPRLLADAYRGAIRLAASHGLKTIAIPAISTGVYGYPKEEAAKIARTAVESALQEHPQITEVRMVFFSEKDAKIFLGSGGAAPEQ